MKPKARFIKSVVEAAQKSDTQMPWERGARREAMIARRAPNPAPARRQSAR